MTMIKSSHNRTSRKFSSFNIDTSNIVTSNATKIGQSVCDIHKKWIRSPSCWSYTRCSVYMIVLVLLFSSFYFFIHSNNDPFDQPFCDPVNGTCHEKPDVASPRTHYSAWNKKQYNDWWKYYEILNKRVEQYATKRQIMYDSNNNIYNNNKSTKNTTRPLILLGDSITESWVGTGLGIPKEHAIGIPQILEDELSSAAGFDPLVLGAAGDQTQHLLYRIQNGYMRAAQLVKSTTTRISLYHEEDVNSVLIYDPSTIFVVMIGTNNLGSGEKPGPTVDGILAVVEFLLEETSDAGCHIILFSVLPRGDGFVTLPKLCPPRCRDSEKKIPYTSFLPAIQKVNEGVKDGIEKLSKTYSSASSSSSSSTSRIQLVECGSEFINDKYHEQQQNNNNDINDNSKLSNNNYEVKKEELMPDLLHPNVEGHRILAKCIQNYVDQIT